MKILDCITNSTWDTMVWLTEDSLVWKVGLQDSKHLKLPKKIAEQAPSFRLIATRGHPGFSDPIDGMMVQSVTDPEATLFFTHFGDNVLSIIEGVRFIYAPGPSRDHINPFGDFAGPNLGLRPEIYCDPGWKTTYVMKPGNRGWGKLDVSTNKLHLFHGQSPIAEPIEIEEWIFSPDHPILDWDIHPTIPTRFFVTLNSEGRVVSLVYDTRSRDWIDHREPLMAYWGGDFVENERPLRKWTRLGYLTINGILEDWLGKRWILSKDQEDRPTVIEKARSKPEKYIKKGRLKISLNGKAYL